jgi:hypothetical protein
MPNFLLETSSMVGFLASGVSRSLGRVQRLPAMRKWLPELGTLNCENGFCYSLIKSQSLFRNLLPV